MSDQEILKGPGYKAQLDIYSCKGSRECIKACPEKAIEEGPERLPAPVCKPDGKYEMLPGKAEIIEDKWTGCGDCVPVCPNQALEMVLKGD